MLFGNPPRWHMITGKTKVPRTAPVAADPNAAGSGKAVHLPDEKVNQLKYDAEKAKTNRDMAAFNDKHLPELISHAKRGDVAAILGTSYGINTHGKRKASIANYLLSEMGSEHRVTPGQKAGTHAGVSGPSKSEVVQMALDHILEDQKQANIPESEKAQDRKLATKIKAEPDKNKAIQLALDHLTEDEKQPDMPKAENADDAKMISMLEQAKTNLSIPEFVEGKTTTGVVDYYRNIAQKVVSMAAAGDSAGVKAMVDKGLKPNAKGVISNTWAGKTENSKRLLALVDQAVGAGASKTGNQQVGSPPGTTQNVVSKAKDLGVQGLRQNMTEKSLRTKLESHLLAKKSEMYLKAGKDSGLPQYSDVDEKAIPVLASIISTNKFSIDTSGSVWSFDGRGIKERGELVKGGILFGARGGYRHDFTKAGREIAHKMLLENFENKSNDDLLREIGNLNNTDKKQNLPTSQKQSSKPEVTISPKEGERNAEGLIFRDGRWHRDDKPPETKKDEYSDDPNSPNYRFKDTGEISGSRKEMAANSIRQAGKTGRMLRSTDIDWEEIESNPREASEIIKKSNLFGLVDWQGLKAEGMSPAAGFLADRVYASISPTPAVDGAQGRKDYAKGIETIRDRIERCKTVDEVTNVLSQIKEELSGTMLSASDADAYKVAYDRYKTLNEKYQAAKKQVDAYAQKWNKATAAKRVADYEVEKRVRRGWKPSAEANKNAVNAEIEAESSYQEYMQARNDIPVKEMEQASMSAFKEAKAIEKASISKNIASNPATRAWIALGSRFFGVVNWRSYKGSDVFSGHVTNAKQGNIKDWSWSEKEHATVKKASKKAIAFQIKVAENFDRKGGRTISANSTSALKSAFNLRDVQSGNWVLKDPKSAEFHVQRAAEAFSDLADIVGAENEHVSMNGRLAVAFGARGVGNAGFGGSARASYEPIHRVINLTKMGGGGCLAHEWFHALDNLIIEAEGGESSKASYATETPELLPASDLKEAFVDLRNAMTSGDERGFVSIKYQKEDVQLAESNVNNRIPNGVAEIIASENNATDALIAVNDYFNKKYNGGKISRKTKNNIDSWRRIAVAYHDKGQSQDGVLTLKAGAKRSSFHHEASILDDNSTGKYWSSMREMAARAFQAYVEDKMSESGRKNDYLSVFADNKYYNDPIFGQQRPFPEGDERKRINESFDRLMSVILARKTLTKAAGLFCTRGAKSFLFARRVA